MRSQRTWRVAVGAIVLAASGFALTAQPAAAACHSFTIKTSPASVTEGAAVNVTVERDAGVNPSSVKVTSVNESATAGSDYPAVNRTVSFASETNQSFSVATTNDEAVEPSETFRLHLSEPAGCTINPNFVIGPDATITIADNDQLAAATTTSAKPIVTRTTKAGQTTTTTGSPTATASASTSTSTEETTTTLDSAPASDDDSRVAAIALGAAALAVIAAIGYVIYRRRTTPAP